MFQEMITARQQVWSSDFSRSYSIAHRNKQRKRCAGFSPLQLPFVPTRGRTPNASAIRKAKRTKVRAPKNLRGARGETRPALRFMERLLSFFRMHGRSGRRPRLENARRRFRRAGRSALRQARTPAATRFMESLLSLLRTHWDHEPLKWRRLISNDLRVRFMGFAGRLCAFASLRLCV